MRGVEAPVPLKFSVVGLGKLGASMAAAIASRGFHVVGVDINPRAVEAVNAGRAPVDETDLSETIAANRRRLRATLDHEEAVLGTDLTFVVVPTPSDDRGAFSLQYAAYALGEIGHALRRKKGYHNVVLTSTVLPGSTRHGLLPILERRSGKRPGRDFGLCYAPEFIALGSVIRDFLNPDFTLVGELDERSGSQLESAYRQILLNRAPCKRMSLENAELAKISLNTYVTMKMTFANMLRDLCERIPGGNVDVVTDALGQDRRIGPNYLKGALGYGGPCFPRDNLALAFFAQAVGARADLAEATDRLNRVNVPAVAARLQAALPRDGTAAILGLSYKPKSNVIEESQGVLLAEALSARGVRVVAHDPLANHHARDRLGQRVLVFDSLRDCLSQADLVLVTTPDPAYARLKPADFPKRKPPVVVFDYWRVLPSTLAKTSHVRYVPAGRSLEDATNAARLDRLWGHAHEAAEAR